MPTPIAEYRGLKLDPFQSEALRHIEAGETVIVAAPTGAGKTLIAEYAIEKALREGRRIIYTAPIKALSNQKFRDFTERYGDRVGVLTGDVSINPFADALIMTTEIFRNTLFESPDRLMDVTYVIFDEVHFMDDPERGTVWEESIIFAPPHIRFLCLSATISNLRDFAAWIGKIRGTPARVILETARPVPLEHRLYIQGYGLGDLEDLRKLDRMVAEGRLARWEDWRRIVRGRDKDLLSDQGRDWQKTLIRHLVETDRLPALYFIFNRRECEARADLCSDLELLDAGEVRRVRELFDALAARFHLDMDGEAQKLRALALRGVSYHHAGLLPTMKEIVEQLFTSGLIRLLFATETFAMGINMPARTVVFDTLHKFDGVRRTYLKAREYQQMAGRAGRRGMDETGYVYGSVEWPFLRHEVAERILTGQAEEVRSQFNLSYSTLLSLYHRLGENLYRACEQSFMNWQLRRKAEEARRRGGGRRGRKGKARENPEFENMVEQVRRRLGVLTRLGYLEGNELTTRGRFAAQIFGYELEITEFFFRGLFDDLGPDEINVLLNAVVFESKRRVWYAELPQGVLQKMKKPGWRIIHHIQQVERSFGVKVLTGRLDFMLGAAVLAWSRGAPFAELAEYTEASDGDIVRTLRTTVQLGRQFMRALEGREEHLRKKLETAMSRIKRDVVDAERQLRMAEGEPAAGGGGRGLVP